MSCYSESSSDESCHRNYCRSHSHRHDRCHRRRPKCKPRSVCLNMCEYVDDKDCNLIKVKCNKLYSTIETLDPLTINEDCKLELKLLDSEDNILSVVDGALTATGGGGINDITSLVLDIQNPGDGTNTIQLTVTQGGNDTMSNVAVINTQDFDWLKLDDTYPSSINDDIYTMGGVFVNSKTVGMKFSATNIVIGKTGLDISNTTETSVGVDALENTSGAVSGVSAYGYRAGQNLNTGSLTTLIGTTAGRGSNTLSFVTVVGADSGLSMTDINNSVFLGDRVGGSANNTGSTVAIGTGTAINILNCDDIVLIGNNAGANLSGSNSAVGIGDAALFGASVLSDVACIGQESGRGASTLTNVVAIGSNNSQDSSDNSNISSLGENALRESSTITEVVAIGQESCRGATTCSTTIALGNASMINGTNNFDSIFIGFDSGSGAENQDNAIYIGTSSGALSTSSSDSVFIGEFSGSLGTGTNNVALGHGTSIATALTNTIALGNGATPTIDNQCIIGDNNLVEVRSAAEFYAPAFNITSDSTLKKDLNEIQNSLQSIKQLTGYTYKWDEEKCIRTPSKEVEIKIKDKTVKKIVPASYYVPPSQFGQTKNGLLAQEVQTISPESVKTDDNGKLSVDYNSIVPMLVNAIKELDAKIEALQQ